MIAVLAVALAIAAGGCGGSTREHPAGGELTDNPFAAPSSSPPSPPPPLLVDFVPKPVNERGYPACGFYTQKKMVDIQDYYFLILGVAVVQDPPLADPGHRRPDLTALYRFTTPDGDWLRHYVTFDETGALSNGASFSPPGTGFYYVTMQIGVVDLEKEYYNRTTTVTVTVDAKKGVAETNEKNNTLTLKVRPTKRGALKITDNKCTIVT